MKPDELGARAVRALLAGRDMTLYLPAGEAWPLGWPSGDQLSADGTGEHYSFDPLKVLAYMQRLGKLINQGPESNEPIEGIDKC